MSEFDRNLPGGDRDGNPPPAHLDADACVDLLHGLLDPASEREVLAHLVACPPCESLLQACVASRERLRATRSLRRLPGGEIASESPAVSAGADPSGERSVPARSLGQVLAEVARRPRRSWRVAAGALVTASLLLVVYLLRSGPAQEPFPVAPLPVVFDAPVLLGDGTAAGTELLRDGLAAYAAGDFQRASRTLGQEAGSGPIETYRLVYLGSALAMSGRYGEAVSVLRSLPRRAVPGHWGSHAAWTLHEALVRSGSEQSADSLLRVMAGELGPDGDRARALLGPRGPSSGAPRRK